MSRFQVAEQKELEEESYFVSMTDMMVGLLFIFILMLMYFALQFHQSTENRQSADAERTRILKAIEENLEKQDIKVIVKEESGILRLPEEALRFPSGQWEIQPEQKPVIRALASALSKVLPCYANGGKASADCPAMRYGLEAVFIEGHTDNKPVGGSVDGNWDLSVARSVSTYKTLISEQPGLSELKNDEGQYLMSVSGYGETRPAASNDTEEHRRTNRRIDLRFIMSTRQQDAVAPIKKQIEEGMK